MKKMVKIIAAGLVATVALVSCASAPAPTTGTTTTPTPAAQRAIKPVIVTHKNELLGKSIPEWVGEEVVAIEAMPAYKDMIVFVGEAKGSNLASAELAARNFGALAQFATFVKTRVQNLFTGAQVGDSAVLETYMENIVKSLSDAQFAGFRNMGSYWVEYQYPGKTGTEFSVYMLYTIDKATVARLLEQKVEEQPKTEEQTRARDLVRSAMEGALPAIGN